jgi:hypothetical protein
MATTYFGSALKAGSGTLTEATDGGFVVMTKTTTVTTTADGLAASATLTLPASAQILDYYVDKVVTQVVGAGSATTLPVTVGTAAAGTQYMASTDLFTNVRAAPTLTVAQVLAMSDIGTNQSVVVTVDPNGTISTTQAVIRLSVVYAQKV